MRKLSEDPPPGGDPGKGGKVTVTATKKVKIDDFWIFPPKNFGNFTFIMPVFCQHTASEPIT